MTVSNPNDQGRPGNRAALPRTAHDSGPTYRLASIVVNTNDDDPDELAAVLRRLADRIDRTPWAPATPWALLDTNGNTCGFFTLEVLP